jgi:hypothetical protein
LEGGEDVNRTRLITLLLFAMILAAAIAGLHVGPAGMSDGGYW